MSEKQFKIDTTSEIGHIYINNQDGEHMSWIEVENTLNEQQSTISQLKQEIGEWKKENKELLDQIQEFERIPKSIRELWVE